MSETPVIEVGQPAPDFTLLDQHGTPHSLADARGSRLVLFFYPEAMTPACTMEACEFQAATPALAANTTLVWGVSRDTPERLARFAERDQLAYPLLSDPDASIHRAYGTYGTKNSYGRIVEGVIRSTFIINAAGRIEQALRNVKATGHVARVLKLLAD